MDSEGIASLQGLGPRRGCVPNYTRPGARRCVVGVQARGEVSKRDSTGGVRARVEAKRGVRWLGAARVRQVAKL